LILRGHLAWGVGCVLPMLLKPPLVAEVFFTRKCSVKVAKMKNIGSATVKIIVNTIS